jgi:hypothetical protein
VYARQLYALLDDANQQLGPDDRREFFTLAALRLRWLDRGRPAG